MKNFINALALSIFWGIFALAASLSAAFIGSAIALYCFT
tara:strand:- start:218 stop:334 length:117 start_codon:yes stop_codon:yes gene_type:complete